jgi:2-polyprenyl-3-methyl-5-hydroxy-6-metoxy-1,4-benzoquinol methylase
MRSSSGWRSSTPGSRKTKQSSRPCSCLRTNASADDRSDRSRSDRLQRQHTHGVDEHVYRGFEDLFRGSEDFIRHRQRFYLGLIRDRQPVLDVGCGRGNFSISSRSRESQRAGSISTPAWWITVERRAHDVELVEGNAYLEQQVDASFGAIFASQVIEHMPHEELMRFFGTARRKLALDGILIAETVNPHSIRAMKAFWVDPTHQTPIFPEVAAALCWLHGYGSMRIVFPNGTGTLERDLFDQGEYAVLATAR